LALLGMMAAHAFPILNGDGGPTAAAVITAGRSATTFVLIAGVGLAFLSGGRGAARGRQRTAVSAGLAVRAMLVGALGLTLGLLSPLDDVQGILPVYGLLFLLAIPLLRLTPLTLSGVAVAAIALGPVLLVATADAGLPYAGVESDPTPATLAHDPLGMLVQLSVTGEYPVVVYLAYLCAGLAIGRLDLHSRRVAWWLLGAGVTMAAAAQIVSAILLHQLGGLARLTANAGSPAEAATLARTIMWEPHLNSSWWYLAVPTPHSHMPLDATHTLGSAMAVLGGSLLLSRIPALARMLRPVAVAGGMALSLYSAHLLFLATAVLRDRPIELYLAMVAGALVFALLWRRFVGPGPLESIVTTASSRIRRSVATRYPARPSTTATSNDPTHPVSQLLWPLAFAAALGLMFWAGAQSEPSQPQPPSTADQSESQPASGPAAPPPTDHSPAQNVGHPAAPPPTDDS